MSLSVSSSKLGNGNTYLMSIFQWLNRPHIALTDVLAITHSASTVKVPNTEYFRYNYTDGKGIHSLGVSSIIRSEVGTAAKFNLKSYGTNVAPYNHNGILGFEVKKGNKNDIRANAYGHYEHVTLGITGSITIKPGSISIGGVTKTSKAAVPMILFNY